MKAKELMIGDWVYRPDCYDQVKETRQNGIIGLDSLRGLIGFSEIKPIPLTPEILEMNGFENIGEDIWQITAKPCWFWVDFLSHEYGCEFNTSTCEDEEDEHRLKLYGIPDVHELQHALRLCGIEKEIIL